MSASDPSRQLFVFDEIVLSGFFISHPSFYGTSIVRSNFRDECFVIACGASHEGASLAAETGTWSYEHIRKRPYYWEDKRLFMKRIVKTVNLRLFQLQKDPHYVKEQLRSEFIVVMTSEKKLWAGSVGSGSVWRIRNGEVANILTSPAALIPLGTQRKPPNSSFQAETFFPGDMVVLFTALFEKEGAQQILSHVFSVHPRSKEALETAANTLIETLTKSYTEAFGCWILVRVPITRQILHLT